MVIEQENFTIELTDKCRTHSEWLAVVRFGLGTLLSNQPLLIEIIFREAAKEIERSGNKTHVPADEASRIFDELGLRIKTIIDGKTLSAAFKEYLESEKGRQGVEPLTTSPDKQSQYLENRLYHAFMAGAGAANSKS